VGNNEGNARGSRGNARGTDTGSGRASKWMPLIQYALHVTV
jgi:hypothetical protein